ncbi:MAG: UDP-glucose 4-epimerase GalE [Kineosporiaceae bacterium]
MAGTWLVTGGAGYIGAHIVRVLRDSGRQVVVLDDLSSGHREFVTDDVGFVNGSLLDPGAVEAALLPGGQPVAGVVHVAGYKYAGVSVDRPLHTYRQNLTGMQQLLEGMVRHEVHRLVFSSSAACYGTPDVDQVTEDTPTRPESPYGETKLIGEWLIRDAARVSPLRHTSLRYFNVVGSGHHDLYDSSPYNLFPLVLKALTEGAAPQVFGTDYATPDGSCVRDYVHVQDIALAHGAAADALEAGRDLAPVYNLGSGDGLSVLEIMAAVRRVTGQDFTPDLQPRRPGDPARIVASGQLAARDLDWRMRHGIDAMVDSAWRAWQAARDAERARDAEPAATRHPTPV